MVETQTGTITSTSLPDAPVANGLNKVVNGGQATDARPSSALFGSAAAENSAVQGGTGTASAADLDASGDSPDQDVTNAANQAVTGGLASLAQEDTLSSADAAAEPSQDGAAPTLTTEHLANAATEILSSGDATGVDVSTADMTTDLPTNTGGTDVKSRFFVSGLGSAVKRVKSGIAENPVTRAWNEAKAEKAEAVARAAMTPEDRAAAVLDQGVKNLRPEQRAAMLALAKDHVQAEFLGADGNKQPLDIAAMGLNADQARQLGVLVEEVQLAALKDARAGRDTEKNENFDIKNSRNVVVRKESDGSVSVVVITSVDGNKVVIDADGTVKPADAEQDDLVFDFVGYKLTEKGKLSTNAGDVKDINLSERGKRPAWQNEEITDVVASASKDPITYTDQLRAMGLPSGDYSESSRKAQIAKPPEVNSTDTVVVDESTLNVKIPAGERLQYRVVDVQRKADLTAEGAEDAAAKRMRQGLRQVLDLEDKGAFENGNIPTIYVGKEDFRHVAQEIAVEGVKIPDKKAEEATTVSTERKMVEVPQKVYDKMMGLTTGERDGVIASMGLDTDPSHVDFKVVTGETPSASNLFPDNSEAVLDQAAGRQALLQTDIQRGEPYLSAALRSTADNAAVIYSLNPTPEGGIKGADDRLQEVRSAVDKAVSENKTDGLSSNEYARQQFESTFSADIGGDAEKQARLNNLVEGLYPLTDREHVAKARTINREDGQSVEDWRSAVRRELSKANLEDGDRDALLNEMTTPKIDYSRLLSIKTQAELDAYDNELKDLGGLPDDIKSAVRLDPVLTDNMLSGLAATSDPSERYSQRKRIEDQFRTTLTDAQRTILDALAPEPKPEPTLQQRISTHSNELDDIAKLFGFGSAADLLAAKKGSQ